MRQVVLRNKTAEGELLEAVFSPDQGMNLMSYRKGGKEVIAQSTQERFEQVFDGLGPMIGPHFYRRKPETIPPIENPSKFPHIARAKELGMTDPFTHGIGRYAPWKAETTERSIKAVLSGKDEWNGVPLMQLEGQDFRMTYDALLTDKELQLSFSVVSDYDSIVGIHFYYDLPGGRGVVRSKVQEHYLNTDCEKKRIPEEWGYQSNHELAFDLQQASDYAFHSYPDPLHGEILLETETHKLKTNYFCNSEENAWQLYHPKGASFVCVEPVSSQNPRRANLTVSSIQIHLEIL